MSRARLALLALAGVALYIVAEQANAVTLYPDGSAELPMDDTADPSVAVDAAGAYYGDDSTVNASALGAADPVAAFLYMLRSCEHNALDVASGRCYQVHYGGGTFSNLSDHPFATGEWTGQTLPPAMCVAAGIASGNCKSTAAGAYQMTYPTWKRMQDRFGLTDFSPASQDIAAQGLLDEVGAVSAIQSGDVAGAIKDAGRLWASLPGARGGQNQRSMDFALNAYNTGATA